MFKPGDEYEIHFLEDIPDATVEGYSTYTVEAWEAPLLKVSGAGQVEVFNTSSPRFIRAILRTRKASGYGLDNV